jgi:hypothetical protein
MTSQKLMLLFMTTAIRLLVIIAMSVCPHNQNYKDAMKRVAKLEDAVEKELEVSDAKDI